MVLPTKSTKVSQLKGETTKGETETQSQTKGETSRPSRPLKARRGNYGVWDVVSREFEFCLPHSFGLRALFHYCCQAVTNEHYHSVLVGELKSFCLNNFHTSLLCE